ALALPELAGPCPAKPCPAPPSRGEPRRAWHGRANASDCFVLPLCHWHPWPAVPNRAAPCHAAPCRAEPRRALACRGMDTYFLASFAVNIPYGPGRLGLLGRQSHRPARPAYSKINSSLSKGMSSVITIRSPLT